MRRRLGTIAAVFLAGGTLLAVAAQPDSATQRYEDKIARCQSFAIEGRSDDVNACRSELGPLLREAQAEQRH